MLKPHDQLTIVRNLIRVRDLRTFRELVEKYFVCSERDVNDTPLDWNGAQAARSRINQMLPGVIQSVRAAGLGGPAAIASSTDPGHGLGRIEVLQQIFSAGYGEGLEQEIFDLLDMAIGVYERGRAAAVARTLNPLHYAVTFLGFLARVPRRILAAFGLVRLPRIAGVAPAELARLESVQAQRNAEISRQLAELAERLDFAERMLTEEPAPRRLPSAEDNDVRTPV